MHAPSPPKKSLDDPAISDTLELDASPMAYCATAVFILVINSIATTVPISVIIIGRTGEYMLLGHDAVSPSGEFQIEGLSPRKMAKVRGVLSSLDIKVYSRRKSRRSIGLGSRKKQRVVKDFLRLENPDVVMIQETKKEECDRSFKECFKSWWSGFQGTGWEGHKFMRKLQFVKANLKEWNKVSFGVLNERKKSILKDIANLDVIEQAGGLSSELIIQRALRKGELEELILREEIHWRQKVRVKWVKEGDCNSKFFHKVANGRRNRKFIKVLENERGVVLNDSESITEEILHYFEKLYSGQIGEPWRVEGLHWSPIFEESASRLDSPLLKKRFIRPYLSWIGIKRRVLMALPLQCFKIVWDVIKEDLVRVFAEFHSSGIINQSANASIIITKVLSGCLRGVLRKTIHSTQGAFVQGRQILDAVLIANEIVDEKRRSGEEGFVLKIDFEKAYDHVSWDFLDHVLEKKGFSPRWRKWMRGCLSSVSFAVLVTGNAKGWVKASRGLRQGDPLSPFLFTLVADILNDTIFFSNTSEEDLQTLKSLLLVFGQISSLRLTLTRVTFMASILNKITFLGNPKACGFWDPVIERILKRLDGWQKAFLSFGGVGEGKRDHLVSWDVVCKPKAIGGFGFWEDSSKECRTLKGNGCGGSLGRVQLYGTRLLHKSFRSFPKFTRFLVGNEDRIRFWKTCDLLVPSLGTLTFAGNLFDPEIEDLKVFPTKFVWNSQVPFKVKSFVWLVAHKKLAKMDWVPRGAFLTCYPSLSVALVYRGEG
ncbi:Transposon TX1 uncharacterized 149 kDa protein [Vitis vinifera]|uniref:Transposon TX1 uncharacterized 149 kDa protein n=1 Tax=Vitis vinifera TaxID=29760 RepID=A0A438EJ97_VITVI|nr:Transposon TX1 uncharacterized 149 kDa protein [Vitis vinifera]